MIVMTNDVKNMHLAFIGCGVMGESMIAGLLRRGIVEPQKVWASHPRAARREELSEKYGITVFDENAEAARAACAHETSAIVLCIKPQRVAKVVADLEGVLHPNDLVISIVAGARIEQLAGSLGTAKIVRAMPNTPSQIGAGITAWTCTEAVAQEDRVHIREVLSALGKELFVETENMIDMATSLSATGPTYVFMVMEALTDSRRTSRLFARYGQGTRPRNNARVGKVCDGVAQASGRAPQHGHVTGRDVGCGDLPDGKRCFANRAFESRLCGL